MTMTRKAGDARHPELSLVFPVFDEVENLAPLLDSALSIATSLASDFEIILVDDGSQDGSSQVIEYWCKMDSRIRAIHYVANHGDGAALGSGLREASGERVFFSDADLQFDLVEIAKLLEHANDFDIVEGYRSPRNDPWPGGVVARTWGALVRLLFGLRVRDIDCAFKLFRREVLESVTLYRALRRI